MVSKTTISIKATQKNAFDRLNAEHMLETGENLNAHEFFGLLLEAYQRLKNIQDKKKVEKLLNKEQDLDG